MPHPLNWYAGWSMILAAFITGAILGMFFTRDEFLGGYASWTRRLTRLGHIALAALGLMNVVFGMAPWPPPGTWQSSSAAIAFVVGGISMPTVCFLAAWKKPLKSLFFIPVAALLIAVLLVLAS